MRSVFRLLVLLFVAVPAWAQDGSQPITATDLFNIRQLGDVEVSPDGRSVVYTVRQAYREGEGAEAKYGYRQHLWMADAAGREAPRPLTRGDAGASQPAWHPDGDRIAFVRTVEGKGQVFVLPLDGGEAWQLTHAPHGATSPAWSPDGKMLLYASAIPEKDVREAEKGAPGWPAERPGRRAGDTDGAAPDPDGSLASVRAWLDANQADANPRVLDRLDFQGENDLEPGLSYRHLFVIEATDSAAPDSARARPLTRGFVSWNGGAWMPGGRQVIVSGNPQTRRHPDRERQSNLYLVDVASGRVVELLRRDGFSLGAPAPAPDGNHVAFVQSDLSDQGFAQSEIGVYALDGRTEPFLVTEAFDRSAGAPRWSPEGRFLYFTAASDGGVPLYRVSPFGADLSDEAAEVDSLALADTIALPGDSLAADALAADSTLLNSSESAFQVERLTGLEGGVGSFDATRSGVFFVVTRVENPSELYRADLRFSAPRALTRHNAGWLETRRVARPEAFSYTTPDSLEVDYWIMKPAFFEAGQRYPLLVEMHGGPAAMWGPGEGSMWHEFQLFAARGYGIVYSNPRGSGGYGYRFQRANYQNWGAAPAADVLGAAHRAAVLPWVDSTRQVLTGGSYAGYLTAWIVGHDGRFKAAVAQRGVYDLRTFFGEGNAWQLVPTHFGGFPWSDTTFVAAPARIAAGDRAPALASDSLAADTMRVDRVVRPRVLGRAAPGDSVEAAPLSIPELLARESPITYVAQIQTPLLIIHGDQDLRTGYVQSEMLYRSLKALEKPVEYVRYPGAGHELSRSGNPKQRLDRLLRIYEFMERYVR